MNKPGGGVPMSRRVRLGSAPDDDCPARHCWVADPADRAGVKRPALLVEWRHTDADEWEGRVVYVARFRPGVWSVVEEWIPAALLSAT